MGRRIDNDDSLTCASCGGWLTVLVDVGPHAMAAGQLQPRTRYMRCGRCAQIQIVEEAATTPDAELIDILEMAMVELGADKGNIQILDPRRKVLSIAVQSGFRADFLDHFREVSAADSSACGLALQAGARVIVADVETDEAFAPHRTIARAAGFRAVQSTPLVGRDGKPLGMLSTHFAAAHQPSAADLERLQVIVERAAGLIERQNRHRD
ncbi:MAG: GAF domain-containing protein [Pseudolabrys sp.]